jgi:DNA-binding NtrC family response regulator
MSYLNAAPDNSGQKAPVPAHGTGAYVHSATPLLVGKHCIVLDDEFLIALDIQHILEREGAASVTCFGSTADCLAALQKGSPVDLAILDFKMGDGQRNSHSVAFRLHEMGTPFIFVTGMTTRDVSSEAFPDAPVIEKPYDKRRLLQAITSIVDGK